MNLYTKEEVEYYMQEAYNMGKEDLITSMNENSPYSDKKKIDKETYKEAVQEFKTLFNKYSSSLGLSHYLDFDESKFWSFGGIFPNKKIGEVKIDEMGIEKNPRLKRNMDKLIQLLDKGTQKFSFYLKPSEKYDWSIECDAYGNVYPAAKSTNRISSYVVYVYVKNS